MKKFLLVFALLGLFVPAFAKDKEQVTIEIVDTSNSTAHGEIVGDGSAASNIAIAIHGKKITHTDAASMRVIINGEHAYLDCFEHHKGCTPIAPGIYNGEMDSKHGGIWVSYDMPLTHKSMRQHYVVAGSW